MQVTRMKLPSNFNPTYLMGKLVQLAKRIFKRLMQLALTWSARMLNLKGVSNYLAYYLTSL